MAEDTVIEIQSIKNETFEELLERLKLKFKEYGDCFANGSLVSKEMPIPNN